MSKFNYNVSELKGVGKKTQELLNKLEIYKVSDLLNYYPRDYFIYSEPIDDLTNINGQFVSVKCIMSSSVIVKRKNGIDMEFATFQMSGITINAMWFRSLYLRNILTKNTQYVLYGKFEVKNNKITIVHPKYFTLEEYNNVLGKMIPVYRLTSGLTNKQLIKFVSESIKLYKESEDYNSETLPCDISEKYELIKHGDALCYIHSPKDKNSFYLARKRFVFEEFFYFRYALNIMQGNKAIYNMSNIVISDFEICDKWINSLPFNLTNDQVKSIEEISSDLKSGKIMRRMLLGDVGSGKTAVAFFLCLAAASNGFQAAIMAPTEVLAIQHLHTFKNWLDAFDNNIKISLLTGSLTASQKKIEYKRISNGEALIIIGTHALIEEGLVYKNLAVSITDEQHRFGVNQRKKLSDKAIEPHSLTMSATPIPRTLAILLYGSSDISKLVEKPSGRIPIKNCMINTSERSLAYNFIKKQIMSGHQAFIICPMIEENEMFECENINDYSVKLKEVFGQNVRISSLHGKMPSKEKDKIMKDFSEHKSDILVSTTVIEVGIDIPNATVMMIENSDRFGLSQLHQLRGRVGRGKEQSYCIFVNSSKKKESSERIKVLVESNDGFKISEADLKFRGSGELFGIRQSGSMNFDFGDVYFDADVLQAASEEADVVYNSNVNKKDQDIIEKMLKEKNMYNNNVL